jgi:hypothetical protein
LIEYRHFRFNQPLTSVVLTYMSIRDEIRNRAAETPPRLFFLPPLIPSVAMVREMFVSQEIMDVAQPPWPATEEGRRLAQMRAYFDGWTEGRLITVADDPYRKPRATIMARIDPVEDDVFDIRCVDPKPGIRVLGCFADFDLFVALTWNQRENLEDDKAWRDEIERCKAAWRRLFSPYPPFHGASLNDYLSNFQPV